MVLNTYSPLPVRIHGHASRTPDSLGHRVKRNHEFGRETRLTGRIDAPLDVDLGQIKVTVHADVCELVALDD